MGFAILERQHLYIESGPWQETPAWQISGCSFHMFSWEWQETPQSILFHLVLRPVWPWNFADDIEKEKKFLLQGECFLSMSWSLSESSVRYCTKKCDGQTDTDGQTWPLTELLTSAKTRDELKYDVSSKDNEKHCDNSTGVVTHDVCYLLTICMDVDPSAHLQTNGCWQPNHHNWLTGQDR